jgi:hypothetical protein
MSPEGSSAADPSRPRPPRKQVEQRAKELVEGGEEGRAPVARDRDAAERAAARLLEESEARTLDPATRDPTDDSVVRRSSEETARP